MQLTVRRLFCFLFPACLPIAITSPVATGAPPTQMYDANGFYVTSVPFGGSTGNHIAAVQGYTTGLALYNSQLYFTDWTQSGQIGEVWRVNTDGSGQTRLVARPADQQPRDVQIVGGMMYWAERPGGSFYRANLDGTGVQAFLTTDAQGHEPIHFTIGNGRAYWTQLNAGGTSDGVVYSRRLDGTDYQARQVGVFDDNLWDMIPSPNGLLIRIGNSPMPGEPPSRIVEMNYTTGQLTNLFSQNLPSGRYLDSFALYGDPGAERIYYAIEEGGPTQMYSMPLSGGGAQLEYTSSYSPLQVILVPTPAATSLIGVGIVLLSRRRRSAVCV